jgi:hypothetical protein
MEIWPLPGEGEDGKEAGELASHERNNNSPAADASPLVARAGLKVSTASACL